MYFLHFFAIGCLVGPCLSRPSYPSTQGVLHYRPSLNQFLTSYLQAAQERNKPPHFGYPQYQPRYQRGYLVHAPQKNIEPFVRYMNLDNDATTRTDYPMYDIENRNLPYSDQDGDWYDSPIDNSDMKNFVREQPSQQDLALAQLMLDHVAGKYSLEDLETLEREARIEDSSENQLRSLIQKVHRKKSYINPYASVPSTRSEGLKEAIASQRVGTAPRVPSVYTGKNLVPVYISQKSGQKEIPIMIPEDSIRRPLFKQSVLNHPFNEKEKKSISSSETDNTTTPVSIKQDGVNTNSPKSIESTQPRKSGVVEVIKVDNQSKSQSTRSPRVQKAYEAFLNYLDGQRREKINSDQQQFLQRPQKRFVRDDTLSRQLNSLKKSTA